METHFTKKHYKSKSQKQNQSIEDNVTQLKKS